MKRSKGGQRGQERTVQIAVNPALPCLFKSNMSDFVSWSLSLSLHSLGESLGESLRRSLGSATSRRLCYAQESRRGEGQVVESRGKEQQNISLRPNNNTSLCGSFSSIHKRKRYVQPDPSDPRLNARSLSGSARMEWNGVCNQGRGF